MADPGVSAQNFLRLLLGGAQKGADVFQQRQSQQQAQAPDLFLALQNMMRQKQQRQEDVEFRERAFQTEQGQASAARARQGNIDIAQMMENFRKRGDDAAKNKREAAESAALVALRLAQAGKAKSQSGFGSQLSQRRLAIQALLGQVTRPENYQEIDKDQYEKLTAPERAGYDAVFDTQGLRSYRRLLPQFVVQRDDLMRKLQSIADLEGIVSAGGMGSAAEGSFADPADGVQDESDPIAEEIAALKKKLGLQ